MKKTALVLPVIGLGAMLSGCGYVPPCNTLPPPTPDEIRVAAQPDRTVEAEVGRTDCEVVGSRWETETE